MQRPELSECAPFYHAYMGELPEGKIDILELLQAQWDTTASLLGGLSDEKALYRYAEEKWSIKEIVAHLIDAERVFAFRALSFARNDPSPLPSMEQDEWVRAAEADRRRLPHLLEELKRVRLATISLFESMSDAMLLRTGHACGCEFSVRTLPYIIAGHELHHQRILRERYL